MSDLELLLKTISATFDNTFVGTLSAGILIAHFGLRIYIKQKKLDTVFSKKLKIQDTATLLLTQTSVAVKDYLAQIAIFDGTNQIANKIWSQIVSISPSSASTMQGDTMNRFNGYVSNITRTLNDLSIPLSLDGKNEKEAEQLNLAIGFLNIAFSATVVIYKSTKDDLKQLSENVRSNFTTAKNILETIIDE